MNEGVLFVGSILVVGLVWVVNGLRKSLQKNFDFGVIFDIGVGVVLMAFSVFHVGGETDINWVWAAMLLPFFLMGVVFCRQFYILVDESDRRSRDLVNSLLVVVPSVMGMFGVVLSVKSVFALFFFSGSLTGVLGVIFVLVKTVQWVQGEREYIRDFVVALVMVSLLSVPLMILFSSLAGFAP